MTDRRDFKKRVRDRQAATGENYTTARAHLLALRERPAVPVLELIDVSEQARLIGLRCPVLIARPLLDEVELVRVLGRVRDALIACEGDPAAEPMRALVLHGAPGPEHRPPLGDAMLYASRRFYARARAGLGGFDMHGMHLALHIDGATVVCSRSTRRDRARPQSLGDREPVLLIDLLSDGPELGAT
jgi:hypothetical protein